jgi:hypothetical protein
MKHTSRLIMGSVALIFAGCSGASDDLAADSTESNLGAAGSVESAVSSSCSTIAVHGLAQQLVDEIECMKPGTLVRIDGFPGVTVSNVVFPYLQAPAAAGLKKAASHQSLSLESALRTLPQQYLLYRWYQSGRCGIGLAAHVGQSNHEQGLAIDTPERSSSALSNAGFHWLGSADPVHWDFRGGGGVDLAGMSTKAFQRLWNRNHPSDHIAEDGDYGNATESRLKQSPAAGFSIGASCAAAASDPADDTTSP